MKNLSFLYQTLLITLATASISQSSHALELSFTHSRGSTLSTSTVEAKQKIESSQISLLGSSSKETASDVSDDSNSYAVIGYKYKFSDGDILDLSIKNANDFYYYDTFGGAFTYQINFKQFPGSKFNFRFDTYKHSYSKDKGEYFSADSTMFGFDQEITKYFTCGASYTKFIYRTQGSYTKDAFRGENTSSDIQNTVLAQADYYTTAYGQFNIYSFSVGGIYRVDTPVVSTASRVFTSIYYGTWQFSQQLVFNLAYTHGKMDVSSYSTDATTVGVNYLF